LAGGIRGNLAGCMGWGSASVGWAGDSRSTGVIALAISSG